VQARRAAAPRGRQARELAIIARAAGTKAGFRTEVMRTGRTGRDVQDRLGHLDPLSRRRSARCPGTPGPAMPVPMPGELKPASCGAS
jgi:hypothetical protein